MTCGFVYYFSPSSAVACFIENAKEELLLIRRGKEPAEGTLNLPGGFVSMSESGGEAACREVGEGTGLHIQNYRCLFSLPNLRMYFGLEVHTLGMLYECLVDNFGSVYAEDDATEIVILRPEGANPKSFGLDSIRKAVPTYLRE